MSETLSTDEVRFAATSKSFFDDSVTEIEFSDWLNSVMAAAWSEGWQDARDDPLAEFGQGENPYRVKEEA